MKTKFNLLILLGLILILVGDTLGQNRTYYSIDTKADYLGSWNTNPSGGDTTPVSFDLGDTFIITNGKQMETTRPWSVSGMNSKVQIENGGILQADYAITLSSATTFQIDNGGTYIHNNTAALSSTILQAGTKTFGPSSNFVFYKCESKIFGISSIVFGNIEINLATQTSNVDFNGKISIVKGNFKVVSTGSSYSLSLTNKDTELEITIDGDLIIEGGTFYFCNGNGSEQKEYKLTLFGNYNQTGGTFSHNNNYATSELNFIFSGSSTSFTNTGTLVNTYINWEQYNSGTLFINSNFNVAAQRMFKITSGNISVALSSTISVSGSLDCRDGIISGDGIFDLLEDGTIMTKNVEGINSSGSTGTIQTGTRKFDVEGSYVYNGTYAQITGDAFSTCKNFTVNNTADVTLSGNTTITGTFFLTEGDILLNGKTLTYSSGATLHYNGTTERTTTNNELPTSGGPTNLRISNNGGVILNSNKTISANVYLTGVLDIGSYTISGIGNFSISGTLKTSNQYGVFSGAGFGSIQTSSITYGNTASYYFYGSNPSQITGDDDNFNQCSILTIANSNGVTLSKNLKVIQKVDLLEGSLILEDNSLTLGGNTTITNAGTGKYINTNGTGKLYRNCTTSETIFPIGYGSYTPASITISSGDTCTFSANVITGHTNQPPIPANCVNKEWNISNVTGSSQTVTLKFQFSNTDCNSGFNYTDVSIGHYSNGAWTELPATITLGDALYSVQGGSISSFSYFTVGNQGAMPVELMAFSGNAVGNQVKLSWSTSSEINNKGFDIERQFSSNGNSYSEWSKVGYIQGNGNSTGIINYNFTDKCTETGKYKYRLKQIDYNGNFEYHNLSTLIDVGTPKKFEISQNYPNPFNPTTKIDFTIPKDANVLIAIFDITGKEVLKVVNENLKAGYYTKDLNLSNQSSGVYFYRIISTAGSEKFVDTKKMVLLK